MPRHPLTLVTATLAVALLGACADGGAPEQVTEVKRDFIAFKNDVYPVLIRDCAFPTCHGAPDRLFRVWGPGRARLERDDGTLLDAFADPSGDEISTSFALSLAMIDPGDPEESLLLRKPVSVAAGGAGHGGVDRYGRDVYRTLDDPGYRALAAWVLAVPEPEAVPEMQMMPPGAAPGPEPGTMP